MLDNNISFFLKYGNARIFHWLDGDSLGGLHYLVVWLIPSNFSLVKLRICNFDALVVVGGYSSPCLFYYIGAHAD